jgi:hypothetical protein
MKLLKLKNLGVATAVCFSLTALAQDSNSPQDDMAYPQNLPVMAGMPSKVANPNSIMNSDPMLWVNSFSPGTGAFIKCDGNCTYRTPDMINMPIAAAMALAEQRTQKKFDEMQSTARQALIKITRDLWAQGGLVSLSMYSQGQRQFIPSGTLFEAYARYQSDVGVATEAVDNLASFFDSSFEGIPLDDKNMIAKKFPAGRSDANVTAFVNSFKGGIRANNKLVAAQNYMIIFPTGEIRITDDGTDQTHYEFGNNDSKAKRDDANGTHPISCADEKCDNLNVHLAPAGIKILNEQHDQLVKQMEDLRRAPPKAFEAVELLHQNLRQDVMGFAALYGQSQITNRIIGWICPQVVCGGVGNLANVRALSEEDAYKDILRDFWIKSALRAVKGFGIGSFTIDYNNKYSAKDFLFGLTDILGTTGKEPLYIKQDFKPGVDQSFDAAAQTQVAAYTSALNYASSKARVLLGTDKTGTSLDQTQSDGVMILKGETSGIFDFANSGLAAIHGQTDNWKAQYLLLRLMAADMYEEKLVRSPGGLAKMQIYYKKRYNKAEKAEIQKYVTEQGLLSYILNQRNQVTKTSDIASQDDDSIKGAVMQLKNALNIWRTRVSQARILELQIDAATGSGSTVESQMEDQRANDLLNDDPSN